MTTITRPALRYHGGKFRLAAWVMRFFPPHRIYTEAFGGVAGVLLQKARISSGRGTGTRTEVVWLNPSCTIALEHAAGGLFAEAIA